MQGANLGRVPPHALEAERAVLGGLMLQNSAIDLVVEIVRNKDFYSEANACIYEYVVGLHRSGTPVDTITLREALAKANRLQLVGGDAYLLALTDTIPIAENICAHAHIVREKAIVRNLIQTGHRIAARGYGDYGCLQEYVDESERAVFEVARTQSSHVDECLRDLVIRAFEGIHARAQSGERISGLTTGLARLDAITAGMHAGELIVIAGRPGMGKTTFALNVGVNACRARLKAGSAAGIAVFSLEMPRDQLVERMIASESRVDSNRLRTGHVGRDEWQSLASTAESLAGLPIFIDDRPALTLMELRAKARRYMAEHGLALIVVDYLQLMRSGTKSDSREQEIAEISRALKAMAKELAIPVIALSQLNRSVESRSNKDKRPQLSDLRESGAIEQDADTIIFVYRDEVYNKETTDRGVAEIIVRKQRAGPTGTVKVRFCGEYMRFENLAEAAEYG